MDLSHLRALKERPGLPALLSALGIGQARFVGGAVRDGLLHHDAKDLDLATPLSPYEVMRRCGAADIKTIPTGVAHGTVTAVSAQHVVEITTLRADLSTDGRRASVAFTDDWQIDAERRDFTMNALYFDPAEDRLHDYFGGIDDLLAGKVRFIGEPLKRIAEDHLRIMRFFRFHARFGGQAEPDPAGLAACVARANDLMALSRERIADEWLKLLALSDPTPTVTLMVDRGILVSVLPEITGAAPARLASLVGAERDSGVAPDPLRRFAALLPRDPPMAEKVAARLKLSNKARKRLALAADTDLGSSGARALAYRVGLEGAQDRLLLAGNRDGLRELDHWVVPKLPISGGALIAGGIEPGPAVARTLKQIEARWVAEGFPSEKRFAQLVDEALSKSR